MSQVMHGEVVVAFPCPQCRCEVHASVVATFDRTTAPQTEIGKHVELRQSCSCILTEDQITLLRQKAWAYAPNKFQTIGEKAPEAVNHPSHYGGKDNPYEVVKVLTAWGMDEDAWLWQTIAYIARHKKKGAPLQDLEKAKFWLDRRIEAMKNEQKET